MAIDNDAQRARWRRNKRAYRERLSSQKPKPPPIDPDFEAAVWVERDRRLRNFPWWVWDLKEMPGHELKRYYPRQTRDATYPFICDVWAAITLLESQYGGDKISNALISSFLWERGKAHGVKRASLRTKVPRARKIIQHLEDAPAPDGVGSHWPKFPATVPERGSGLKQHVDMVMNNLGLSPD